MDKYFKMFFILFSVLYVLSAAEINYVIQYKSEAKQMSEQTVKQLVADALDYEISRYPYYEARVEVYTSQDDYLVVWLFRSDVYLANCYRLEIVSDEVTEVVEDYIPPDEGDKVCSSCPDNDVQAVFSYGVTFQTAKEGAETATDIARAAGLKTVLLDNREETSQTIKDYLTCPNLIIWGRIGHGNSSTIALGSGSVNSSYFQSLDDDALVGRTLVINSCQVHNNPLEPAVLSAGTYFYAGGDVSLVVGPSERVFMNFMDRAITDKQEMEQALEDAIDEERYEGYGCSGYGSGPWYLSMSPYVSIGRPNGGEEWELGNSYSITWSDNLDDNVTIELFKGGSLLEVLASSTASDGEFEWTIPADQDTGDDYTIRITCVTNDTLTDESDEPFAIEPEYIVSEYPYVEPFEDLDTGKTLLPKKWEQLLDDDIEWLVLSGPTPSKVGSSPDITGPDGDHTTGDGNYIYVEASNPNNPEKRADFVTSKFDLRNLVNPVLTFWCHMYSANDEMGHLYLDINVDGTWHEDVLHLTDDHGDEWFEVTQDLAGYIGNRVVFRFRDITGESWASDICIDDFSIDAPTKISKNTRLSSLYSLKAYNARIFYEIPDAAGTVQNHMSISLYTLQGKLVQTLVDGIAQPGFHSIPLTRVGKDARPLARGVYLCRMKTKDFTKTINVLVE